jgi:hypothetical protein
MNSTSRRPAASTRSGTSAISHCRLSCAPRRSRRAGAPASISILAEPSSSPRRDGRCHGLSSSSRSKARARSKSSPRSPTVRGRSTGSSSGGSSLDTVGGSPDCGSTCSSVTLRSSSCSTRSCNCASGICSTSMLWIMRGARRSDWPVRSFWEVSNRTRRWYGQRNRGLSPPDGDRRSPRRWRRDAPVRSGCPRAVRGPAATRPRPVP